MRTKKTKRQTKINWSARVPYIKKMMRTMTDAEIAKLYHVPTKRINDIRKYWGLLREGETSYRLYRRTPETKPELPLKWDFRGMDVITKACYH